MIEEAQIYLKIKSENDKLLSGEINHGLLYEYYGKMGYYGKERRHES